MKFNPCPSNVWTEHKIEEFIRTAINPFTRSYHEMKTSITVLTSHVKLFIALFIEHTFVFSIFPTECSPVLKIHTTVYQIPLNFHSCFKVLLQEVSPCLGSEISTFVSFCVFVLYYSLRLCQCDGKRSQVISWFSLGFLSLWLLFHRPTIISYIFP